MSRTVVPVTDELASLVESLESERGSERLQQLYDRLDESGLTQSELAEMAEEANRGETISALETISQGDTKC